MPVLLNFSQAYNQNLCILHKQNQNNLHLALSLYHPIHMDYQQTAWHIVQSLYQVLIFVLLPLSAFSLLLLLCICSSKLSTWIKMPALIVFLGVGMLIDLPKESLDAENISLANWIGTIAMIYILFAGGFETKWSSVKKVAFRGVLLSTVGVLLTAVFVGLFTYYFLKWQYRRRFWKWKRGV